MFKSVKHDDLIYVYCDVITILGLVNAQHLIQLELKKKKCLLEMRALRVYSFNLPVYHTSVTTIVDTLYLISLVITYYNWKFIPVDYLPLISPQLTQLKQWPECPP